MGTYQIDKLKDLENRLAEATTPDRALDFDIAFALGVLPANAALFSCEELHRVVGCKRWRWWSVCCRASSLSLELAIPHESFGSPHAKLDPHMENDETWRWWKGGRGEAKAATAPLALLLALVRALIAKGEQ